MPRELITVQIGQCGNQIGCRFWDLALHEHASHQKSRPAAGSSAGATAPVFDDAMSSFFRNVDARDGTMEIPVGDGTAPISSLKARAVLIDMEEGVINETLNGPLGELFDQRQFITDVSGSGNNWAHGHAVYGPQYADAIAESVRREAERCDSLQCFLLLHSMGGGTGSGLGTFVLGRLADAYPEVYRFVTAVFPSADDDVITSPYNSVLALRELAEYASCVLPVENQALLDLCGRAENASAGTRDRGKARPRPSSGGGGGAAAGSAGSASGRGSGTMQRLARRGPIRRIVRSSTGPVRSGSTLCDSGRRSDRGGGGGGTGGGVRAGRSDDGKPFDKMNNIAAHLLTNLTSSMRFEGSLNVDLNEITTNLVPFPRLPFLLSSMSPLFVPSDVGQVLPPRRLDQMFSDAFDPRMQLCTSALDPKLSTYLACAFLVRGSPLHVGISDLTHNVERLRPDLRMVHWNADGFKIGLCDVPPVGQPYSLLCLGNNCGVRHTFTDMRARFMKLYRVKAHVHHYTQMNVERGVFERALASLDSVVAEYVSLENAHACLDPPPRLAPAFAL